MTEKFVITGMTCAACQANVTRCVSKLEGVEEVNVSLLANQMTVSYDESKVGEEDIIQAVELGSREAMVAFCKGIQSAAPVDSYVTPEPWAMPGYESEVIMAAGAFVQGASIELSADGPIRPPYAVYFQGGLTWFHAKLGILMSIQKLLDAGIIEM
jgi:cystathionine beta-lyase family protein involved in aluminum resistance